MKSTRDGRGELMKWLIRELKVDPEHCYSVRGPLYLKQFFQLVEAAHAPELLEKPWPPAPVPELVDSASVFQAVARHKSLLIAPPYQSFDAVVALLEQAAEMSKLSPRMPKISDKMLTELEGMIRGTAKGVTTRMRQPRV